MKIALLKESHAHEGRVALTPAQIKILTREGHLVLVMKGAGLGSGFFDSDYTKSGAKIYSSFSQIISQADLIIKVKEPLLSEIKFMKPGQMVFSFLHLAALPQIRRALIRKKIIALGYEMVQLSDGSLPLLAPMSEIAGKMATQLGAHFLRSDQGGRGILLGGTKKVNPATVVVLGGGVVGEGAIRVACGIGASVYVLDKNKKRLTILKNKYKGLHVFLSTPETIARLVQEADLLIGAVLIPGKKAPILVSKNLVKKMKKGSVIIDVAVDQGGCVETTQKTTHAKPIVVKHGVAHYGVPNIPGLVPSTATLALTKETFPYIQILAKWGLAALQKFPQLQKAVC
ncbi:MAG: alanine dehydrogenase [Deltaproteobacteria bacterium RIFCSPLOWO2_12_FULL_40_28]|nr:MAG: alanine dehydrogenase [Deltaproteobacteria bacterium RIFCSPHIGHO2_02_FULL_40_28]OGQ19236.1 MAG: alanine dehydrogenase [Deltaproteobacteria bacterium RIFCSPHIGHO2_12_FULL_40_32]OGQ40540.1 MAG: alanine dehydrogenase [Deltaproteobacteria bacterium RIFCSPLOWO2_02_FULL_40_36]OGQ53775.1 MAG: alanine dehydrogenase [Deltaproteobacteria bacterium RIFCSPLOWO2_12_FULL_40_28]